MISAVSMRLPITIAAGMSTWAWPHASMRIAATRPGAHPCMRSGLTSISKTSPLKPTHAHNSRRFRVRRLSSSLRVGDSQTYWLPDQPLAVDAVKPLLRQLATALGADLSAAEVARVLRLPGTLNHKYTPPRAVVVETWDAFRRSRLADLRAVLSTTDDASTATSQTTSNIARPRRRSRHRSAKAIRSSDTRCMEACRLRRLGWENEEIADALWSLHTHRSEGVPEMSGARAEE